MENLAPSEFGKTLACMSESLSNVYNQVAGDLSLDGSEVDDPQKQPFIVPLDQTLGYLLQTVQNTDTRDNGEALEAMYTGCLPHVVTTMHLLRHYNGAPARKKEVQNILLGPNFRNLIYEIVFKIQRKALLGNNQDMSLTPAQEIEVSKQANIMVEAAIVSLLSDDEAEVNGASSYMEGFMTMFGNSISENEKAKESH